MNNLKEKMSLHPVMTFLILTAITMVVSGILNILDFSQYAYSINSTTLEYSMHLSSVENMFSIAGLRYIFSETVANFVSFTPFSTLIIVLIGFGVMEKSGFLKTAISFITKKMKKNTVTFLIIFVSVISSVMGDISYVIMLPLSALIFKYGKRNPLIGVVASFAGLTCGQGLSFIFTSMDSSLLSESLLAARVIDVTYRMASISGVFIMAVAVILISVVLTNITEKITASRFGKYELEEEIEEKPMPKRELRGLLFAIFGGTIYLIIFLYNFFKIY